MSSHRPARLSTTIVALLALATALPAAARETTDLVVLVNGNNINGEIMGLSRGKLDYKTDDAGRLSIEWLKVVRATSTYTYEIFADFNTGLNFTDTYDTRPPEGGVNNDFNLSITIGWWYRR